ncbi:hypothetical protein TRFO_26006 [Tritrichomonas foetus]|uniref:DUF3447 domain-containing protein n=1 Tax=Tritrichomonas foetus TaxID=1144522 RepID=A0A1J4K8T5_9EUKA|nr:hypothetical protein TRFO_26006 [Tritrichomonas foetus]|eukprot:OHT06086.1 hypothetical protein TRFO_26006 [Tritrichomonas foetus]
MCQKPRLIRPEDNIEIVVNGQKTMFLQKDNVTTTSKKMNVFFKNNPDSQKYEINIPEINTQNYVDIIENIFSNNNIDIHFSNYDICKIISKEFEIEKLSALLDGYIHVRDEFYKAYINEPTIKNHSSLVNFLLSFNEANIEESCDILTSFLSTMKEKQFFHTLLNVFLWNKNYYYLDFPGCPLDLILKNLEKVSDGIYDRFREFVDIKFPKFIENLGQYRYIYMMHHKSKKILNHELDFQSLIKDGLPIYEMIMNDDINSVQGLISNLLLDIDKTLTINPKPDMQMTLSLINIAAFCGSVKCFKFLWMNHAEIERENIGICAVFGNNWEIVHICDQSGYSFQSTLPISIQYHYNSLTKWLIENQKDDFDSSLIKLCLQFNNYKILKYLISKGFSFDQLVPYAMLNHNYTMVKFLLKYIAEGERSYLNENGNIDIILNCL